MNAGVKIQKFFLKNVDFFNKNHYFHQKSYGKIWTKSLYFIDFQFFKKIVKIFTKKCYSIKINV